MPASTLTYSSTLVIMECCSCHMSFAMPADFEEQCRNSNRVMFFCPGGHEQHYGTSQVTVLKRKLEQAEQERDWAESARKAALDQAQTAEYRRRAAAGQVTRIKKRVANGVCPCCHRTFVNVARHMAGQHPDFEQADA